MRFLFANGTGRKLLERTEEKNIFYSSGRVLRLADSNVDHQFVIS